MINLKTHIYSLLSADETIVSIVGDNIHFFNDDSEEMENFDERLPQITFARIVSSLGGAGVRNETYQLSAWWKDPGSAEELSMELVRLFNRTSDASYKKCTVEHINDTYDSQTKAYGVHITARFAILDQSY